ncbi:imm11 family protein [Cohnella sp. GCM10020058]|uniref:imm11 family protein n=1 Tax=Cohnella sp. GCM10020058 TaxID=3317330 RepID=UPI00362FF15B
MKVYQLNSDHQDQLFYDNMEHNYPIYFENQFNGVPVERWGDLKFYSNKGLDLDIIALSAGTLALSKKAIVATQDLLADKVETLPLEHDSLELFAINVINIIPALDRSRSQLTLWPDGEIRKITQYAFSQEIIKDAAIFKLPEFITTYIFVTDVFRERVLQYNLTGFRFIELWDSETNSATEEMQRQRYLEKLAEIERTKGPEYSFAEVTERMRKENKAAVSGKQKLELDEKDSLLIGDLLEDTLTYAWMDPVYIPPIFLDMKWHLVEKEPVLKLGR